MKRSLIVAVAFIAITVPATWLWLEWGRAAYAVQFEALVSTFNELFGMTGNPEGGRRIRYINFIPLIGLLLVTPGLSAKRRFGGLAIGMLVLFASHLVINAFSGQDFGRGLRLRPTVSIVSDALPFVIWAFVAAGPLSDWMTRRRDGEQAPGASTHSSTPTDPP